MKKRGLSILILSCLLAGGLLFKFSLPVTAASPTPESAPTAIVLAQLDAVGLGKPFSLLGILEDQNGKGISDKTIVFTISGIVIGQVSTKNDGTFQTNMNKVMPAGNYEITASFKGTRLLAPSADHTSLKILPATVQVQTIPAIAGVTFKMDGRLFISDANGLATIQINTAGMYRLDTLIDQYHDTAQRITFGRWTEESYEPFRDVQVPINDVIQVGLNVFHQVNFTYLDLDKYPVDPARISGVTIKSIQGDVFNLQAGQAVWLPSSRTARRQSGLSETKLLYSVISVTIDGSNVVNQSQQRFYAEKNDNWTISLLLYTLGIEVKDGLFASPVGKTAIVKYPDGQDRSYTLNKSAKIEIHSLARGIYHIELTGANGLKTNIPVALSRNQIVSIKVLTYLDLATVGLIGLLVAIGLVLYGRPWIILNLIKKKQPASKNTEWASIHEN
jgi:hypothetical protein